jgi:DNA-binding beta-propeller fold protein YncE
MFGNIETLEVYVTNINHAFWIVTVAALAAALPQQQIAADDGGAYHVAQVLQIGGKGGWDYVTVDFRNKLLYLPRSTHTLVVDANNGTVKADIQGQKGNHGVALVRNANRGFITDGGDGSVVIFDTKTYEVLGKVKAADDADAIIYDRASGKVLVSCGDANALVPIAADVDPKTGKADATIDLGGKPEALVADGQGKVYVNLVDKNQVAVVDSRALKVLAKWPTAPGGGPVGMAIDRQQHRLFVGCRNPQKLLVMSADDGKILADLPIGAGCDGTAFDGDAFASCRDGSLAVARETSPGKFEIIQNLKTRPGAKTCGVDRSTHTLFLPTAEFGTERDARNRPVPKPDSFMVLVVRRSGS